MKWGISTGTCAALAAKAAALMLVRGESSEQVDVVLPDGSSVTNRVSDIYCDGMKASATVIKDAGDDPDVTHGTPLIVTLHRNRVNRVRFFAGPGVGTVTRAGLAIPPGEPAINPGPRKIICAALSSVTTEGFDVTVSVPQGLKLAPRTFNPRLGIEGGISILGTTGRVRPFSAPALRDSLKCSLNVAIAARLTELVLVPGNMGHRAAKRYFDVSEQQIVDVSNEWGYMLGQAEKCPLEHLLVLGHPGKLGKLAAGQWQTHSAQSASAIPYIARLAQDLFPSQSFQVNTVEELFMQKLQAPQREQLGNRLAEAIMHQIAATYPGLPQLTVALINLKGELLGHCGDDQKWRVK
ncbi:cobalt-precorrin-5B (C1)-methyltransferase [Desulfuromusa kysingii]|uniref:Cobalt-precorrin-5B C(1)-methyltransferase n=1 Tax=Desulfuromusa kysingii TaxID=37625 RepID=A0A1H4AI25_9BACT|nr:cobalt-precorrin-5B (C(1))-methyltransferase CbiD [Desulfuromusa kysingii]SEA35565.1 cobalt-precorrin-5B (C1)-methyltransferase [Desulfuromusa kysingii]